MVDVDSLRARIDRMFVSPGSDSTPGGVVGVARAGAPTFYRAWGVTNLEVPTPIDTGTVFEAGSVSKQFTAGAVLRLAQQGKLTLDDDVRRWLPELRADLPRVTIRQLLHHQSGWRDWGDLVELQGWPRGTRAFTMEDALALLARQRALNFAPGDEYLYSNTNYVLAALIVQRASGEPFAQYCRRALFLPLGMTHTQWRDDYTRRVPRRATAWTPNDDGAWQLDMPFENVIGHGGLLTTVPDLLRWQANFLNPRLGGADWVREMETDGRLNNGAPSGYALGLHVEMREGRCRVDHAGATAGYRAYVGREPARGVAVALLANAGSLRSDLLGPGLLDAALGDAPAADEAAPELGPEATTGPRAALAGLYRSGRTGQPITVAAFRDGLTLNRWSAYRDSGVGTFVNAAGTRALRFDPPPAGIALPLRFVSVGPGGDTIVYERVAPWTPTVAERRALIGVYRSDEVDAAWRIEAAGDTLLLVGRGGVRDPLEPVHRDAFSGSDSGWLVTFTRGTRGAITGFEVGMTRTRRVPFRRTP